MARETPARMDGGSVMARKSRRNKEENGFLTGVQTSGSHLDFTQTETAAYVRLSSEKEDDESIETQIMMIRQFISRNPELKLADIYEDNGYSGTNFNRPGFLRMMDDVRNGKIRCIVVKDLSRFGRNFLEVGYYLETVLPYLNVRFISINDAYDSSRTGGRDNLSVPVKNIVNELYAKDISKKVRASYETASKNGTKTIGNSTFGYTVDRENNVLVPDLDTAPCVQIIFKWFLMGYTTFQIARRLDMLEVPTPSAIKAGREKRQVPGSDCWTDDKVMTILRNQTYAGDTVHGKKMSDLSKKIKNHKRTREEWIIHKDTHEPLISREEFQKVQEHFDAASRKTKVEKAAFDESREEFHDYFHAKVHCMGCGNTMHYFRYSRKQCHANKKYTEAFYICMENNGKPHCGQKIHEDYLKMVVMDQIRNLAAVMCDRKKLLKKMQSGQDVEGSLPALRKKSAALTAQLSKTLDARENLYESLKSGLIDQDEYQMLKEHYIHDEQTLKADIAAAEEKRNETERKIQRCLEIAEHLEEYLEVKKLDERMAEELIDEIHVSSDGKIEIRFTCSDAFADMLELVDGVAAGRAEVAPV